MTDVYSPDENENSSSKPKAKKVNRTTQALSNVDRRIKDKKLEAKKEAQRLSDKRKEIKKLEELKAKSQGTAQDNIVTTEDLNNTTPSGKTLLLEGTEPVWIPDFDPDLTAEENVWNVEHTPGIQARFLSSSEDEVIFTGGRGSGKSDCLIVDPLPLCVYKNFRGLVLRNTTKELRELISRARDLYPQVYPGVKYHKMESMFTFPSGATIEFGYCDNMDDVDQYKGQQYTWMGVDEISKLPDEKMIDKLKGSLRSVDPNLSTYFRATSNPDGPGRMWIKKRWGIGRVPAEVTMVKKYTTPLGIQYVTRKWFDSKPTDNKSLMKYDPDYLGSLYDIDNEVLRKQWLENNWDSCDGLAFNEFNPKVHVVKPFQIDSRWYRFKAADWGYSSMAACLWMAVSPTGQIVVYKEYTTRLQTADKFQEKMNELDGNEHISKQVLDGQVWVSHGEMGETPGDTMLRLGGRWIPADKSKGSRKAGKLLLHQHLQRDPATGEPGIVFFDTCTEIINELQTLMLNPDDSEDIDTRKKATVPDHAYDALRYGLSSRPPRRDQYNDWMHGPMKIKEYNYEPVSSSFGY